MNSAKKERRAKLKAEAAREGEKIRGKAEKMREMLQAREEENKRLEEEERQRALEREKRRLEAKEKRAAEEVSLTLFC